MVMRNNATIFIRCSVMFPPFEERRTTAMKIWSASTRMKKVCPKMICMTTIYNRLNGIGNKVQGREVKKKYWEFQEGYFIPLGF